MPVPRKAKIVSNIGCLIVEISRSRDFFHPVKKLSSDYLEIRCLNKFPFNNQNGLIRIVNYLFRISSTRDVNLPKPNPICYHTQTIFFVKSKNVFFVL